MKSLRAVILEDENVAMRRLKRMLKDIFNDQLEILADFEAIADLADYLLSNPHPDVLFLDILVADGNSFDLFDIVDVRSNVIFITAYDEYAIKAFRKNAVDYLLKPLKINELEQAVKKLSPINQDAIVELKKNIEPYKQRFLIPFGNKLHSVRTEDIAYIYSEDKMSFFILHDGNRVPSDLRLQYLEVSLDPKLFFRVNRQFIVHIDAIDKMLRYSRSRINIRLLPSYPQEIIVSTETTPKFKSWMNR